MNKLEQIEQEYGEKLRKASIAENYDEMLNLFFELNILRKRFSTSRSIYKKQGFAPTRQRKNDIRK